MPTDWAAAGVAVKHRRLDLKMSQRRCGVLADVSPTTWGHIESGQNVSEMTRRAAAEVLGWPATAIDDIANGADPSSLPTTETPAHRPFEERLSALEERLEGVVEQLEDLASQSRRDS